MPLGISAFFVMLILRFFCLSYLLFSFCLAAPLPPITQTFENQTFSFQAGEEMALQIRFYRPDVVRVEIAKGGNFADPLNDPQKAQILVVNTLKKTEVEVEESSDKITFITSALRLSLDKKKSTFRLEDATGKLLTQEIAPITIGKEKTTQTLSIGDNEQFFGGGQQNGYFTHRGSAIDIVADGNWNEGGHPNPAPFYMSSRGYGVLRQTFSPGHYDFSQKEFIQLSHEEERFDAFYFVGKDIKQVLNLYTQFTGRPNFIPLWGFEMGEADAYMTRDKDTKELVKNKDGSYVETTPDCIDRLAKKYRENDFPAGWILPNDGYGCGYVELPYVVKELHKLGFYTGLWTEKDITQTEWEVGTAGIRVQKLDVAWTGPAYQFSLDANRQAWRSLVKNSNSRGFVWTVQGWAGTQRYSVCWTGDQYGSWDLIRYHIPTLIGSGLSGQAYATTDVDGIFGGSPETYTRDLQWKCFTPVLYAMNGWAGDISKSPWAYPQRYKDINRSYLKLKMRFMPYMYTLAKEAHDTGAPIVRGMLWEFPKDSKTYDKTTQHQYMLGNALLVAPVFTSEAVNKGWRREDIYLPQGIWIDYWDGRRVKGGQSIDNYPAPLEKLPLLVRGGAIIPLYPEMLYNNQKPKNPLTWDIYPHGESSYTLYEDDGLTRAYQKGEFATQKVSVKAPLMTEAGDIFVTLHPPKGTFKGQLKERNYIFTIHCEAPPKALYCNGKKLRRIPTLQALVEHTKEDVWSYDPSDRRGVLTVCLAKRSVDTDLTLKAEIDANQAIAKSPAYPEPPMSEDVDKTQIKAWASSQSENTPITNSIDGTKNTFWHSEYRKGKEGSFPYTLDYDLGHLYALRGIHYLPRQSGKNGLIKGYELFVSRYPDQWGAPIAKGVFSGGRELEKLHFKTTWVRYVKLVLLDGYGKKSYGAVAEIDFIQDLKAPPLPEKTAFLSDLEILDSQGAYAIDKSLSGRPLKVNGKEYKKGIACKAPCIIDYALNGHWDVLAGHVGMDGSSGEKGRVLFRVYGEGKLLFESPRQTPQSIKQLVKVNIKGVKKLRLEVLGGGGEVSPEDLGDWIDMMLIEKGSKE